MNRGMNPGDSKARSKNSFSSALKHEVRDLSPAYFAMVMATGIVSIAGHLLGMRLVAIPLFWLNIATYVVLWVLSVLRLILYPHQFLGDLIDHQRGPGFFTVASSHYSLD